MGCDFVTVHALGGLRPVAALKYSIMNSPASTSNQTVTRRDFLKYSSVALAGAATAAQLPFVVTSHAAPDDPIRIGLIGCGGRGTGAVADALGAATDVKYPNAGYHTENITSAGKPLGS